MFKYAPIYWSREVWMGIFIPISFVSFGWWLDRKEDLRMTRFRDKSALYGRELMPGEQPSWP